MTPPGGARMGEVVAFIPKSERERARLIREARAIYEAIFPTQLPADDTAEQATRESCLCGVR